MRLSIVCSVALSLSLVAAAFPGSLKFGKRTVAGVQRDISTISTQVTALGVSVNKFPNSGGTFLDGLNIHNSAGTIEATINKATADIKNTGSVSETDGNALLQSVQVLQPQILAALGAVTAKKPAFDQLILPPILGPLDIKGIIRRDLNNRRAATTAYGNALIAAAPDDLKDAGRSILTALDAEFAKALATYAA